MSEREKIRLEIANFENFLRVGTPEFDRYEPQRPLEPDLIAWKGDTTFGVEITNFHRQDEKRRESEEDKTLDAAFELYNESLGPKLLLHLMWASHFKIGKTDRPWIAKRIAALARRYAPSPEKWMTLDWQHFDRDLMSIIDHISMDGLHDGMSPTGTRPEARACRSGIRRFCKR